jgi:hypothetical protein
LREFIIVAGQRLPFTPEEQGFVTIEKIAATHIIPDDAHELAAMLPGVPGFVKGGCAVNPMFCSGVGELDDLWPGVGGLHGFE